MGSEMCIRDSNYMYYLLPTIIIAIFLDVINPSLSVDWIKMTSKVNEQKNAKIGKLENSEKSCVSVPRRTCFS